MALYLGSSEKLKVNLDNTVCSLNLYSNAAAITNGIKLTSSEGYILKDINGVYLTAKEDE